MNQSAKALTGYEVRSDGRLIGSVGDLIVSKIGWSLRYLRVNLTSESQQSRLLPISVAAPLDNERGWVPVALTLGEILGGPPVVTGRPLTRAEELAIHRHYCWAPYWHDTDAECEPSLIALRDILGCQVDAIDGVVGPLTDLVVEDDFWTILSLIAKPARTPTESAVAIPPKLVDAVDIAGKRITVRARRSDLAAAGNRPGRDDPADASSGVTEKRA